MGKKKRSLGELREELRDGEYSMRMGCVPDCMVLEQHKNSGFHFGRMRGCKYLYVGKPQAMEGHILTIGETGSGKTSGQLVPTFGTWKGPKIIIDIKANSGVIKQWYSQNRGTGKKLKVFSPGETCRFSPGETFRSGYDPFAHLRADGEEYLFSNVKELALTLLPMQPETRDRVWIKNAQNLLTATILHCFPGMTFSDTMTILYEKSVKELISDILKGSNPEAKMLVHNLKGLKHETLAGIGMDLADAVIFATDPLVSSALCSKSNHSFIDWSDFSNTEAPYDIILQIPEDRLEQWEPLVKLLLTQLIRTLERRPEKTSRKGNNLQPILIMLDEFSRLGKLPAVISGLATLRSRGVTFALFIQQFAKLDQLYGKEGRREIFGHCSYKAILKVTDPDDQEYLSRAIGTMAVHSMSHCFNSHDEKANSTTISLSHEPVIFPHEFAINEDIILCHNKGFCRIVKAPYFLKDT
jgi:type IV secretion system protein VirD4